MRDLMPFVVTGVTTAAVYALAAMGLVVTYSTSGVFNFAQGAIGMVCAYACYSLREHTATPTWLAAGLCVVVLAPLIGLIIDRLLLPGLSRASSIAYVVVSLGLLVMLQGLVIAIYGGNDRPFAALFSRSTFRVAEVNVGYDQVAVVLCAAAAGIGLAILLRGTHIGLQMRAVVNDRDLTAMTGTDPRMLTSLSWMFGCSFAALAAILLAPFVGLSTAVLTLLVVQAFGAAVVGRLQSIPWTILGAVVVGLGASLLTKAVSSRPDLSGLPSSLPFLVLFVVLIVSPANRFGSARAEPVDRSGPTAPTRRRGGVPAALLVLAIGAGLTLDGGRLVTGTVTLAFALIFSSLSLLTGTARQISLCHALFVALGATTLAHLAESGMPYLLALLLTGLTFVPVALLIALPAVRLNGLFLALLTFGFGVLAQNLIFPTGLAFGTRGSLLIERPEVFGASLLGDRAMYWFALAVAGAGMAAVEVIRRTRLGRTLRALGDSPTALESLGVRPAVANVLVFCTSAFLAAIGGGLLATTYQQITTTTFDYFQSLLWLTLLTAAGAASLGGVALAAFVLVALPTIVTSSQVVEYQPVIFGALAMVLAQSRNGIAGLVRIPAFADLAAGARWRLARSPVAARTEEPLAPELST
jgi:branched-subunit amino acid ABC-type transport system permease component